MKNEKERLIRELVEMGYIKSEAVRKAMEKVPREEFLPPDQRRYAYLDQPLPIGEGQTVSAPHMVAMICEVLDLKKGMKVLEIGAGCGYNAAVVAEIVGKEGHVYSIERIKSLYNMAKNNLKRLGYDDRVTVIFGDGTLGYPDAAPYDRIYVTASAPQIPPPLKKQLKVGGKLLIPVGSSRFYQNLILVEKIKENKYETHNLGGVAFVPLIGKYGWKE
ncbi:protein-L-isoaspartate O-methyltransferase [Methanothermus fervidus DSM 2088]|uniref:Protein-L-isoaspartate O-methyltransferase n=1 Tax=Methanothermus fervidus (strain ATCC 43054 / DSM 2088 / JCM 10308 / V24 S) TaxID=523846 RepID=E3GXH4_METFV|nr:protein-L-isoaspartate O-methyltransferase [Methanothermus fervidus]ADP77006.1 protein-L-isoaspartate O-methyltransferase [Methanothermus fervidus DSM 2088]